MTANCFPSGIASLDDVLRGGFVKPANFLLISAPLAAKRELGMTLLNGGLCRDEAAIYVSTSHTAEEVENQWSQYGFQAGWEQEGRVKFVDCYARMLSTQVADTANIRRIPAFWIILNWQ
jgi:KaiC/GvpD/RAD55 family RecA-like ATPase